MAARHIHTNRAVYSASNVREALAAALTEIKDEDSLTDADIGAVLGKSADRAREYRLGTSTMIEAAFRRTAALNSSAILTCEELREPRYTVSVASNLFLVSSNNTHNSSCSRALISCMIR